MDKFCIMSRMKYLQCALYFGGYTGKLAAHKLFNYGDMVNGVVVRNHKCTLTLLSLLFS